MIYYMSTIFYSWQSDKPKTKTFIKKALNYAINELSKNALNLLDSPRMDSDTKNVSGAPDIVSTILSKIGNSDVFVADVSIAGKISEDRCVVNQNVAFELGYACGCLGDDRLILIFDKSCGDVSDLPFDIRNRRILLCNSSDREEKLGAELANIIGDMMNKPRIDNLDETERIVLELFAKMTGDRSVVLFKTLGGICPGYKYLTNKNDDTPKKFEGVESGKLIATLDDMVDKGLLSFELVGKQSSKQYSLAKNGYKLIDRLGL